MSAFELRMAIRRAVKFLRVVERQGARLDARHVTAAAGVQADALEHALQADDRAFSADLLAMASQPDKPRGKA